MHKAEAAEHLRKLRLIHRGCGLVDAEPLKIALSLLWPTLVLTRYLERKHIDVASDRCAVAHALAILEASDRSI
jgi:hypothetical protein